MFDFSNESINYFSELHIYLYCFSFISKRLLHFSPDSIAFTPGITISHGFIPFAILPVSNSFYQYTSDHKTCS